MEPVRTTVFLVEDDADLLHVTAALLESVGLHVVVARNGRDALHRMNETVVSVAAARCVAVIDMHLPLMDGAELIAEMRASPQLARIPVIVAGGGDEVVAGARFAVRKPYEIDELAHLVHRAVAEPA